MPKKVLKKLQISSQDATMYLLIAIVAVAMGTILATGVIASGDFAKVLGGSFILTGVILLGISIFCNLKTVKTKKR